MNLSIRLIIFLVLFIEVSFFMKISVFYRLLPLLLLPLFFKLALFLVKRYLEIYINQMNFKVQTLTLNGVISLQDYINLMATKIINKEEDLQISITLNPDFVKNWEEENAITMDYDQTKIKYIDIIEDYIIYYTVILTFELKKKPLELYSNFLIRFGYLVIWSYVLYLNDPSTFFIIVKNILYNSESVEPFSELYL